MKKITKMTNGIKILLIVFIVSIATLSAVYLINKEVTNDRPMETVVTATNSQGLEIDVTNKNNVKLQEINIIKNLVKECLRIEEIISYKNYGSNLGSEFYTKEYKKKRLSQNLIRKSELIKYQIDKFIHSELIMSVNFQSANMTAITSVFYADVINHCNSSAYLSKNGYSPDGSQEKYVQYVLIKKNGKWLIQEERNI